jgi:Fe-S oxidoreductase
MAEALGTPPAPTLDGVSGPLAEIYEGTLDCVHCGLCLPACPTYRATGRERSSPRGRIYLMRGVAEGKIPLAELVAEEAYLCLGCRACETACPSGVRFGELLEGTRAEVERRGLRSGRAKDVERFILRHIVPHRRRLRAVVRMTAWSQRLRLDRLAAKVLPSGLADLLERAPRIPRRRQTLPVSVSAVGERRGLVALFSGCVMPELYGEVHHATLRVLAANGYDVAIPPDQGCCGALHAHSGDREFARGLAAVNLEAFDRPDIEAIIVNSAGCGASMREVGRWLPGEGEAFAASVRDIAEFLDEVGLRPPPNAFEARVAYDDPCHLVHGQGVRDAPRRILEALPGLRLIPHRDPTSCCGAAGIYNLTHPEMSQQVLERKLDSLLEAEVDYVATGNPGCLMQLERGLRERGSKARVVHPIELLDRAYRLQGAASGKESRPG